MRISAQLPQVPSDATTAAAIAQHSGLCVEDALRAAVASREMQRLRVDSSAKGAVTLLIQRLDLSAPPPIRQSTSPLPAAAVMASSPIESHITSSARSEPNAHVLPSLTSASEGANSERGSLKRARVGADSPGSVATSAPSAVSEIEAGKERELSRQLSRLTGEINEAMRAGDRAKVVSLMRHRDQIRANKNAAPSPVTASGTGDTKRGRLVRS